MTAAKSPISNFYRKLSERGFKSAFVKSLLPDWWDDEIAASPVGQQQAALLLGRLLGVKPESIWQGDQILLSLPAKQKFKRRVDVPDTKLDVACAIAYSAGRLANRGFSIPFNPQGILDAAALRKLLLNDNPWVGLAELLNYCASIGIPVIFLRNFPAGAKKMAGVAFAINDRPVIALTQVKEHGYLLFDLAHEMGHIALGHIDHDQLVIDAQIDQDSEDEDEKAANRYALELLTGNPDCRVVPTGRNLTGEELAAAARRFGQDRNVDPSHVALNYGYSKKHWGAASVALACLAKGKGTAKSDQQLVVETLFSNLDSEQMGEADWSALKVLTGDNF